MKQILKNIISFCLALSFLLLANISAFAQSNLNWQTPPRLDSKALNELGYLLLGQSTGEAIESFELAAHLYPSSENSWDSLSEAYLEKELYKKALAATEKSINLARKQKSSNLEYFREKQVEILEKIKE